MLYYIKDGVTVMIKFKQYSDTIDEASLLVTTDSHALDVVLKDLKKKMENDLNHNRLGFVNTIAKHVKKKLNKRMQVKGRVAVEPL